MCGGGGGGGGCCDLGNTRRLMPGLVVPARAERGGAFYLFLRTLFYYPGRAGAVVSRAIGPPVGSLHAAQAV